MQLRFASFAVVSLWEDFHLQDRAHAGRTTKNPAMCAGFSGKNVSYAITSPRRTRASRHRDYDGRGAERFGVEVRFHARQDTGSELDRARNLCGEIRLRDRKTTID